MVVLNGRFKHWIKKQNILILLLFELQRPVTEHWSSIYVSIFTDKHLLVRDAGGGGGKLRRAPP
jgi:hypothetical protein